MDSIEDRRTIRKGGYSEKASRGFLKSTRICPDLMMRSTPRFVVLKLFESGIIDDKKSLRYIFTLIL